MRVFEITVFKIYLEDFLTLEFPGQIIKSDFYGKYILLEKTEFLEFLRKNVKNEIVKTWLKKRNVRPKKDGS